MRHPYTQTHAYTACTHCTPANKFLPVVLPAQLKPDTTADTAEKCRHSTTCINITRTGRACPFLRVTCRHQKCVGRREGGWGGPEDDTRVATVACGGGEEQHSSSLFLPLHLVFSLRGVVAWARGVCARTSRCTGHRHGCHHPPVLSRGRLQHSWRGRDRPGRPCGLCTSPVRPRPLASQTGPLA